MSFEIQPIIDETKQVFIDAYGDAYEEIKPMIEKLLLDKKDRLTLLTEQQAAGELGEGFFLERLKEEPKILAQEFELLTVAGKQISQDTANKAIEVFAGALLDLAGTIGEGEPAPVTDPENQPVDKSLNMGEVPEEDPDDDFDKWQDEEKKTL